MFIHDIGAVGHMQSMIRLLPSVALFLLFVSNGEGQVASTRQSVIVDFPSKLTTHFRLKLTS